MVGKFGELQAFLYENSRYDVICISETWFHEKILSTRFGIPEYEVFRKDNTAKPEGSGVAILSRKKLHIYEHSSFFNNTIDFIICVMPTFNDGSRLAIVSVCWSTATY